MRDEQIRFSETLFYLTKSRLSRGHQEDQDVNLDLPRSKVERQVRTELKRKAKVQDGDTSTTVLENVAAEILVGKARVYLKNLRRQREEMELAASKLKNAMKFGKGESEEDGDLEDLDRELLLLPPLPGQRSLADLAEPPCASVSQADWQSGSGLLIHRWLYEDDDRNGAR